MTTEELALLVRNLPQAQSLDLYRLGQAIRMLYSEPKRVVSIRMHLHLGMMVRFLGSDANTFHTGRIVAMQDHGVTIDEPALNLRHSNIPLSACHAPVSDMPNRSLRCGASYTCTVSIWS